MEIVSKDERLEYRRWPEDDQPKSLFNSSLKASLPARLAAADFIEARNQPFQAEFSHAETMVADRRGCQLLASNGGGFFEVGRKPMRGSQLTRCCQSNPAMPKFAVPMVSPKLKPRGAVVDEISSRLIPIARTILHQVPPR